MKKHLATTLAILAAWIAFGANSAHAQSGGQIGKPPARTRPTVSPFINMGTGNSALNYYGIIKPQFDANRNFTDLQQGIAQLNTDGTLKGPLGQQDPVGVQGGLQTGHPAGFFNYSHYFPTTPYGGAGTAMQMGGGIGGANSVGNIGGAGFGVGGGNFGAGAGNFGGVGGNRTFYGPIFYTGPR